MKSLPWFWLVLFVTLARLPAAEEARTALVVGCDYPGSDLELPSPVRDAKALAATLKDKLEFEVVLLPNPTRKQLLDGIDRFGELLTRRGGVGLFYFSGHGAQHDDENYLIPAGAALGFREDLPSEAVTAQRVVTRMENAGNRVNLLFLDACRNNKLPSSRQKGVLSKGLAGMNAANGMLIGFATARNTAALDGGEGSLYTNALLKHLTAPGLSVTDMLTRVNAEVRRESGGKQVPFMEVGLSDVFCFLPGGLPPLPPVAPPSPRQTPQTSPLPSFREEPIIAPAPTPRPSPPVEMAKLSVNPPLPPVASAPTPPLPALSATVPKAGQNFTNGAGAEMVWIGPGSFTMGSPESEEGRSSDETSHRVTLTRGYWLGKTEVTQGLYEAVIGTNPSRFKNAGANAPVDNVTWNEAKAFCAKLTERERAVGRLPTGHVYSLPTEAQWEYAARAGTTGAVYNVDALTPWKIVGRHNAPVLDAIAWYGGNSGVSYEGGQDSSSWPEKQKNHKRAGTHPVGEKQPNAFGLYDMIGNMWEWCEDRHGDYPVGSVSDPRGPATGSLRVFRGGDWSDIASNARVASRNAFDPGSKGRGIGFRLALVPSGRG